MDTIYIQIKSDVLFYTIRKYYEKYKSHGDVISLKNLFEHNLCRHFMTQFLQYSRNVRLVILAHISDIDADVAYMCTQCT